VRSRLINQGAPGCRVSLKQSVHVHYSELAKRCRTLAVATICPLIKARFFSLAVLCEGDAKLVAGSRRALANSKQLLAAIDQVLLRR
jgi:hypothetical protein